MKISLIAVPAFVLLANTAVLAADNASSLANGQKTATPIKHVIVVIGENISFDTLFGAYVPPIGRSVFNLLSEGIINADGTPGPRYGNAVQRLGSDRPASTLWNRYASLPTKSCRNRH